MVKISNIRLVNLASEDEDTRLMESLNDTKALYPKDQTIHTLFEQKARQYPDAVAVTDRKRSLTYSQLSEESSRLATFLQARGIGEESVVGLLLDNSADTIVAMLSILKAGGAYLPMDPGLPYERLSFLVQDTQATVVISEKKFLKTLNRLQWDCPTLAHYLCVDTDQLYAEKESANELMQEELWDYIGETAHDDISGGAWFSSYTGEDLTRQDMDEYADNILHKLKPYLTPQTRVLEIGCSSGISMFRIAPHVGYYLGTDLSGKILETTAREVAAKGFTHIRLEHLPAHAVDQLDEGDFDIVILNSVIQCFDGHHYLRDVLHKAIGCMKDTGLIFLGDLQDNDRKANLLAELETFQQTHAGQVQKTKTDWSNELFLSRQFLNELAVDEPAIRSVVHSEKIGTAQNELTRFRYDTILTIDKTASVSTKIQKTKFQWGNNDLAHAAATPTPAGKPSGLAYIIYTSGSTGQPKGCLITHENVVRLMHNNRHPFDFSERDVWIMAHASNFDFSVWEMYGALLYGGKLVVPAREEVKDVKRLLELVHTHRVTVFNQTPLAFYYFIEQALNQPAIRLDEHLRYVIFGGDRLDYGKLQPWVQRYPLDRIRLINMYGITETTVHVTYYAVQPDDLTTRSEQSLIGKPLPETTVYILNEQKNMVPLGMIGEMYVGGTGVCRGYLHRDDLTAERFIPHPFKPAERLYRTGDRGRWLPEGNLEFLGRVDDQVKIRGFRIEPKEIEVRLRKHAGVQDICVYTCEDASGETYLEAALTLSEAARQQLPTPAGASETPAETLNQQIQSDGWGHAFLKDVQTFAAQQLPAYMVPASFRIVTHIPLTSNGKVDKKAVRKLPDLNKGTQSTYTAPRTDWEKRVAAVWEEVLGKKEISVTDNFFDLGGHSLKATRVLSHIHARFHKKITLGAFFENAILEKLALVLEQTPEDTYSFSGPLSVQDAYDVSHAQQRLWILSQFEGGNTVYNIPVAFVVEGALDVAAFTKAIQAMIARHESLRTTFTTRNGVLKQVIHAADAIDFQIDFEDWTDRPTQETDLHQWLTAEAQTVFDLAHGPLLRVGLRHYEAGRYMLAVTLHHIISDAWSLQVLIQELVELYNAFQNGKPNPLLPLVVHYKEYAAWQRQQLSGERLQKHRTYWLNQLQGEIPVLDLPTDFPRPAVKTFHGNSLTYELTAPLVQQLEALATQHHSSLFMVLLAAVKVLLYRYTRQTDLVVGSSIAGRDARELENQVGFYINMLVMRTPLDAEKPFTEFLQAVRNTTLGAYEHQLYPFDRLVDDLNLPRDQSRSPLFDVLVELINVGSAATDTENPEGFSVKPYETDYRISKYDLTFRFVEQPQGLTLILEYNTDLYRPERIETFRTHLQILLASIAEDAQRPVYALPFYNPAEVQAAYPDLFTDTLPVEPTHETILDLWNKQVQRHPEAVAIRAGNQVLTYQQTDDAAEAMADYLRTEGNSQPESIVGVLGHRSPQFVIGLLGILKAGGAFLPIDPNQPADRIRHMLNGVEVHMLLLDTEFLPDVVEYYDGPLCALNPTPTPPPKGGAFSNVVQKPLPNGEGLGVGFSLAYLIYTSGSTGTPKAVGVTHANLYHYISWANEAYFQNQTGHSFGLFTSLSFDLTITSIFSPLTRGDELVILDEKPMDALLREQFREGSGITAVKLTPSHVTLLGQLGLEKTDVSTVILGGEAVKGTHIQILQRLNPSMQIFNEYGPTETTVGCAIQELTDPAALITIGKPITNMQMLILDEHLQLLPPYLTGEVCIFGPGVTRGYLNNAEQTAQKFIQNPFRKTRLYRSGDLGYLLPNGEIVLKGRTDEQVKIRGYRIEPGEIAAVLAAHPDVQDAFVTTTGSDEDKQLVAFVASARVTDSALRSYLSSRLPAYMVPSGIRVLETLPLNANGKTDRHALLSLHTAQPTNSTYEPPRTPLEEKLVPLWEEVLERSPIGIHDHFFTLGGHSLRAILLISRIQQELGLQADLGSLFSQPTIAGLAEILAHAEPVGMDSIEALPEQDSYEVSHAQRRLWVLNQLEDDLTAYTIPNAVTLDGNLDTQAFTKALRTVVGRHEILRTYFVSMDGQPRQQIASLAAVEEAFQYTDLRQLPDREEQSEKLLQQAANSYFDLSRAPLFRTHLARLEDDRYLFLFTVHHILSDGWSAEVLMQEIVQVYEAYSQGQDNPLKPLRIQYKDFAAWQNRQLSGDALHTHQQYWKNQFADGVPVLDLPTDFPRPDLKTYHGNRVLGRLDADTSRALQALCSHQRASRFMALFATVGAFLYRYTGQTELVLGTPNAVRSHAELENQVGLYLNTLALKTTIQPNETLETLIARTQTHLREALAHQDYPFDRLVDDLTLPRDLSRSPLFDVLVVSQDFQGIDTQENTSVQPTESPAGSVTVQAVTVPLTTTKYDLTFNFSQATDGIQVVLEYNTDLFTESRMIRLLNHYLTLVRAAVQQPDAAILQVNYLPEEEKNRLLVEYNATTADFPSDKTIVQLFETQASATPDAVAIRFEDITVSYRQLNELSNQLAHFLIKKYDIQTGDCIALQMHRSERMLVALLGILKTGAAYLPLDPAYPAERVRYMLADAQAKCVLVEAPDIQAEMEEICPVVSGADWEEISQHPTDNLPARASATDLIYILYTSGSTGKPKGTLLEHQAIVNRLYWMWKHYDFTPADVILQKTPYVFDVSVWELFMPLCFGASLVPCPQEVVFDAQQLVNYIADYQITTLHFVPSMLNLFLQNVPEPKDGAVSEKLSSVKRVFASGEALLPHTVAEHYRKTQIPLHNLYGPTEAAVDVSYYATQPSDTQIPIGTPISNVELHVLDRAGQLVAEGVWGELAIGGVCLARGYLNRPELTAEKFVQLSINQTETRRLYWTGDICRWQNGQIEYKGRKDTQVKLRGQRIELSEIENCLLTHPHIEAAAVAIQLDLRQEQVLVGYVVSKEEVEPLALRQHLALSVPAYMIPAQFVFLDKLPLTVSGKLDRKALPVPQETEAGHRTDYVAPSTELETLLATLVQEVLGRKQLSIRDNFFTIGGDSIKAIQIASRVHQLGYKVTTRDIFMYPTVEDLARVTQKATRMADQHPVTGDMPLTPIQADFLAHVQTDPHHYNQSILLHAPHFLEHTIIQAIFDQLFLHHDALRLQMRRDADGTLHAHNAGPEVMLTVQAFDYRQQPDAHQRLEQQAAQLQAAFDLENGLLAQVALFHLDDGDRLLMVFHHLVIDGVSWRILFEDLHTLYQAHNHGRTPVLPLKTDAYQTWATRLTDYASSPALLAEIPYWQARTASGSVPLRHDGTGTQNLLSDEKTRGFELTADETRQLLTQVNQTYKTDINDLLLTALSSAVQQVFDVPQVWIDMEGHGREEIIPDIDISRTVGWFTSLYPVVLESSRLSPLDYQLKTVKETLRQVPRKGIGYGILRYLTPTEHTALLSLDQQSPILFNYLGQIDEDLQNPVFTLASEYAGPTQSPRAERRHDLVVTAIVAEGKLRVSVAYSPGQYREETIQALNNACQTALWEIIRHCTTLAHKELVTPSDLGFKGLTMDQLENFFK